MRIKALMTKDTHEFVHIREYHGVYEAWTCRLPYCYPESASWTDLSDYFAKHFPHIDISRYELVEFDLVKREHKSYFFK